MNSTIRERQIKLFYRESLKNLRRNACMLARVASEIGMQYNYVIPHRSYNGTKKSILLNSSNERNSIAKRDRDVPLQKMIKKEYIYTYNNYEN